MTAGPATTARLKDFQKAAWSAGDYTLVAGSTVIASEQLVEVADIGPGDKVLDAACGSGNATIAAARRLADVTGLDFSAAMLSDAGRRLESERAPARLVEGDLEDLPFADGGFDVVTSAFGAMFAPNQKVVASELLRVCRPGGRIALASWSGGGAMGRLFARMARYVPPTPGVSDPTTWGDPAGLATLFGDDAKFLHCEEREFVFRYHSPQHWMDQFRTHFGPTRLTFEMLPARLADALSADLVEMWSEFNRVTDGRLVAPVRYLEAVLVKTG
jgi:SAM-dependent methyltransferase